MVSNVFFWEHHQHQAVCGGSREAASFLETKYTKLRSDSGRILQRSLPWWHGSRGWRASAFSSSCACYVVSALSSYSVCCLLLLLVLMLLVVSRMLVRLLLKPRGTRKRRLSKLVNTTPPRSIQVCLCVCASLCAWHVLSPSPPLSRAITHTHTRLTPPSLSFPAHLSPSSSWPERCFDHSCG